MWKKVMNRENVKKLVVISLLKKVFLLAILLIANASWAATCEAGFVDTLNIKVIDYKYRPIEGAAVTVTYQKDQTTGKGYVTTNAQYTGADGMVTETIRNIEVFQGRVACDITISAEYDGKTVTRKLTAQNHPVETQVRFETVYLLNLQVVDRFGQPLSNTSIRVNEMYRNTSNSGTVAILVNKGVVDVAVPYLSGVISEKITVNDDLYYVLQARIYSMKIKVVDDQGQPLVADIYVENNEYRGSEADVPEIALANPIVKVVYGSLEKEIPVNLVEKSEYTVSFDLTPPEIRNIEVKGKEGMLKISFYVYDSGAFASGADIKETKVSYTVGGITKTAVPYLASGAYEIEIPAPPENTLLRFTITTYDKEGNMNTVNGEYLVIPEEEVPPVNGENGGTVEEPVEDDLGIILVALGGIVVLALGYLVIRYVRGLSEES